MLAPDDFRYCDVIFNLDNVVKRPGWTHGILLPPFIEISSTLERSTRTKHHQLFMILYVARSSRDLVYSL